MGANPYQVRTAGEPACSATNETTKEPLSEWHRAAQHMNDNRPMPMIQLTLSASPIRAMTNDGGESLTSRVVQHFEQVLSNDRIKQGERLPSERTVANDLRISRNTVTAAYSELEQRGLIRRIRGKGAFCCNRKVEGEAFSWSGKISTNAHLLDEPILEMLARSCASGLPHPLSAGTPSLECFPVEDYRVSINRVIDNSFPHALAVAPTAGQPRLRQSIAAWMGVDANRVMITSGGQEAIDLLVRCLIQRGDHAIVDDPTYPGAIQCLRAGGAKLIGWDTNWCLEKLEELILRFRPKLIFTTPTFQNPTGKVMRQSVRTGLLELAARYHIPILEDDVYSRTYLDGICPPPSLLKLDRHSQVIYISTFSKILAPGLRVGWVVAPPYMVKQLSLMKMRANLFTGGLNQLALSDMIETGSMFRHLDRMRQLHCVLRETAASALQPAQDEGLLKFHKPEGGLFLWAKLSRPLDLDMLLSTLEERGVSIAPGNAFFPNKARSTYLRICYTAAATQQVRRGIKILVSTLREALTGDAHCAILLSSQQDHQWKSNCGGATPEAAKKPRRR
jgi:DNA-binding transcriptional MocR family regulator